MGKNEIKAEIEIRKIYLTAYIGAQYLIIIGLYQEFNKLDKSIGLALAILALIFLRLIIKHRNKIMELAKKLDELEREE